MKTRTRPDSGITGDALSAWRIAAEMLQRPYPLSPRVIVPVVTLLVLVPFYLFIPEFNAGRLPHLPETSWDRALPVQPIWAVVYGSHLLFVIFPVLIMREEEQIRRTFLAYLLVWIVGFLVFLAYPTVIHRPTIASDGDFFAWSLRLVYACDPPQNCFPSLHVAHSFVSAFTCYRVHRGVGIAAFVWAGLIGLATLFTKQHYIADVLAGSLLGSAAYFVFFRGYAAKPVAALDRRAAPILMTGLIGLWGVVVGGFWFFHLAGVK